MKPDSTPISILVHAFNLGLIVLRLGHLVVDLHGTAIERLNGTEVVLVIVSKWGPQGSSLLLAQGPCLQN